MQSIFDFIATQPEIVVNKIYGSSDPDNQSSPWACKAIFSSLSALSKNYVFRCLSIHEPLTTIDLEKWVKPELKHLHLKAIDELIKLRILVEVYSDEMAAQKLQMNSYFRRGFQYTLCNPIEPWCNTTASMILKPDKKAPTREELDEHCGEKWNDVLRCILNIPLPSAAGDSTIENFLKCTGLVMENSKRHHEITSDGYEYLLKDHQSQVLFLCMRECVSPPFLIVMPLQLQQQLINEQADISFIRFGYLFCNHYRALRIRKKLWCCFFCYLTVNSEAVTLSKLSRKVRSSSSLNSLRLD